LKLGGNALDNTWLVLLGSLQVIPFPVNCALGAINGGYFQVITPNFDESISMTF
jgi:hypothetical protein